MPSGQVGAKGANAPSANTKVTAALQQPAEPVAAPEVQIPPAESTTETWADPIADSSSYGTADSDDPPSAVSTPPTLQFARLFRWTIDMAGVLHKGL
jgi:hypothetical protein